MGDFNARIQIKQDDTETPFGKYTFGNNNIRFERQSDGAEDNRSRFLTYCINNHLKVMNTMLDKPEEKRLNFAEMGVAGPPYTRHRHEMIDFIQTSDRWKNTVKNCESDITYIETMRKPVWAGVRIKHKHEFKAQTKTDKVRYDICQKQER